MINWTDKSVSLPAVVILIYSFCMNWGVAAANDQFGIHIHYPEKLEWSDIGAGWWRLWDTHDTWALIEGSKGTYDWSSLDNHVKWAQLHNLKIVYVLAMTPQWASSRPLERSAYANGNAAPPKNIEDWGNYVRSVAARYKGRISHYEIWNETDFPSFYSGSIDQYVDMLKEARKQIKAIDPTAVILTPSVTGLDDLDFFERLFPKIVNSVDVISFHGYTPNSDHSKVWFPPEEVASRIKRIQEIMANNHVNIPIWNTETGYPVQIINRVAGNFGSPARVMTAYLIRSYAVNFALNVDKVFWYALDNPINGSMLLNDPASRDISTLKAYQNFASLTDGLLCSGRYSFSDQNIWIVPCQGSRKQVSIIWSTGKDERTIKISSAVRDIFDMYGDPKKIAGNTISISQEPIFVETNISPKFSN